MMVYDTFYVMFVGYYQVLLLHVSQSRSRRSHSDHRINSGAKVEWSAQVIQDCIHVLSAGSRRLLVQRHDRRLIWHSEGRTRLLGVNPICSVRPYSLYKIQTESGRSFLYSCLYKLKYGTTKLLEAVYERSESEWAYAFSLYIEFFLLLDLRSGTVGCSRFVIEGQNCVLKLTV